MRGVIERLADPEALNLHRYAPPEVGSQRSAVLVLFGPGGGSGDDPDNDGPDVLLIERAATLRKHAGQIAFPGGAADDGEDDPAVTALREAGEEVGLDPSSAEVVAYFPEVWIPGSNYAVTPVIAWWRHPHPVGVVDVAEVARVARLPLAELVDPDNRLRVRHPSGFVGPAFEVRGMLVWGFTALVLSTLLDLAKWSVPWNEDRIKQLPEVRL
ncbi:MAG: CoA pyrophosphatase [Longispora sp.]|nr:CoA pyrophosphatase [Longispora sp. (in: high G+C Gram-positive bacteria)]